MNFINDFITLTSEYESPTSFWRWSAYAVVAATLRNNAYIQAGLKRYYPNIYVVLLADSAEYRKSGGPVMATSLLNEAGKTKIFSGRNSIQKILQNLSQDKPSAYSNGITVKGGGAILIAEELASFFVEDPQCVPILTDIYDFRENYEYGLKSETVTIKNLCITMLAASNETFLKEVYDNRAVYGGLLGRTFMIKPDERREGNSLLRIAKEKCDKQGILEDLKKIGSLSGPFILEENAIAFYEKWYKKLYTSYSKIKDRTGVTHRIHAGVLKIAMVLAASRGSLTITYEDVEEAIVQTTSLRANYEAYAMSSGKGTQAAAGAILLNALFDAPDYKMERKQVLLDHWHQITSEELDKLVETLTQAGMIAVISNAPRIFYQMTPKCLEIFNKQES